MLRFNVFRIGSKETTNSSNLPFLLRINKTGLNQTINTGTKLNLLTLVSFSDEVIFANVPTSSYNLTSGILKTPNFSEYIDYNIDIRMTGTISGNAQQAREFSIELTRADDTLLERKAVIKINDTTLGSRGTVLETYSLDQNDPFITSGLKLYLNNSSGQTITLTGLSIIIKGVR